MIAPRRAFFAACAALVVAACGSDPTTRVPDGASETATAADSAQGETAAETLGTDTETLGTDTETATETVATETVATETTATETTATETVGGETTTPDGADETSDTGLDTTSETTPETGPDTGPEVLDCSAGCPPQWPQGAALSATQTAPGTVHLVWPAATDDVAVAGYILLVDAQPALNFGADVTTTTVTDLAPAAHTFRLFVIDDAGNVNTNGLEATLTVVDQPPVFADPPEPAPPFLDDMPFSSPARTPSRPAWTRAPSARAEPASCAAWSMPKAAPRSRA